MSEIDWSKAPAWAGAVVEGEKGARFWVSQFGGVSARQRIGDMYPDNDALADMGGRDNKWRLVGTRHAHWSGEGLPPIGARVRVIDNGTLRYGHGESGEVVAHVDNTAVVRMSYGLGCFEADCLAPELTPEQIAAEDRTKAIYAMAKDCPSMTTCMAGELYDAGYRKVQP